ncbi:MAG: hypothetical protein OK457_07795 [Thaumarchaeota archaeon]|nr:hypothetical protein [Nitrososphaerota archaeon]
MADDLIHESISKHQVIYLKAETLVDSIHVSNSLSKKEEWESMLYDVKSASLDSAKLLHRASKAIDAD